MSKTAEPRNSSWGPPSKWSFQSPLSAKEMYLIDHGFSWLIVSFLLSAPFLLVCVSFFVFARFYLSLEPTFHRQPFIRNNGESCPLLTWFRVLMNCVWRVVYIFVHLLDDAESLRADLLCLLLLLFPLWTSQMHLQVVTSPWSLSCIDLEAYHCE